jgi:hypothetical protein
MRFSLVRVGVVFLALMLAACGGGGDDEEGTTLATQPATETTVAEETPDTTAAAEEPDAGSDDGIDLTTICLDATQAMAAAISSYTTGMAGAMGGSLDDESLQLAAGQLQAMADAAPDEIKEDLAVIAEELGAFFAALADIGYEAGGAPSPEQMAELSAIAEVIDQESFQTASDNLNVWFEANC